MQINGGDEEYIQNFGTETSKNTASRQNEEVGIKVIPDK
jgi:hypothetical protein